jgi:hypothetical protein
MEMHERFGVLGADRAHVERRSGSRENVTFEFAGVLANLRGVTG